MKMAQGASLQVAEVEVVEVASLKPCSSKV